MSPRLKQYFEGSYCFKLPPENFLSPHESTEIRQMCLVYDWFVQALSGEEKPYELHSRICHLHRFIATNYNVVNANDLVITRNSIQGCVCLLAAKN